MRWSALAMAGCVLIGCRSQPGAPSVAPTDKATAVPADPTDPGLLRALSVLATGHAPSDLELSQTSRDLESGATTLSRYIDQLLASEAFTSRIAPLIILGHFLSQDALGAGAFTLSHTDGPKSVYYLNAPCTWEKAIEVHPWWNLIAGNDQTVRVCPDSYRPQQWMVKGANGPTNFACLSVYVSTVDKRGGCGCGPNLIRCFESHEQGQLVGDSLVDEIRSSVTHNIAGDLPIEEIFTSNETFRNRYAEYVMRTYVAADTRKPLPDGALSDLASWPEDGKWAPREDLAPGQNAGILTSPQIVHFALDRRQRMTAIYDVLWCMDAESKGATPEAVLSIAGSDLQIKSAGWKELAARPICTSCHARLDYGFQFFWGFPDDNVQAYFQSNLQQTGRGPLYVHNIDDPRGEGELTPQGFANLATSQPEFRRCMARDFASYVLGNEISNDQVASIASHMTPNSTTGRDLMRASLRELVRQWPEQSRAPTLGTSRSAAPRDHIAVTGALKKQLGDHCVFCHDHEAGRPNLAAPQLTRPMVVDMLEAVAFGSMPKGHPLAEPERTQFLSAFINAIWSGADADAAHHYFVDRMRAIPSYRPEIMFELIHDMAHSTVPPRWRMMENAIRGDLLQLTPGMITVTGLEAISACHGQGRSRAEIDACISKALELENLTGRP